MGKALQAGPAVKPAGLVTSAAMGELKNDGLDSLDFLELGTWNGHLLAGTLSVSQSDTDPGAVQLIDSYIRNLFSMSSVSVQTPTKPLLWSQHHAAYLRHKDKQGTTLNVPRLNYSAGLNIRHRTHSWIKRSTQDAPLMPPTCSHYIYTSLVSTNRAI